MTEKIRPDHLRRIAYVYVRQSSAHQVRHHQESRQRQYALADRARTLGFAETVVIDEDQGKSGSGRQARSGFGRLLTAVCQGQAGGAHSRFPGHALTPTGVMAIRCKQFHLPDL